MQRACYYVYLNVTEGFVQYASEIMQSRADNYKLANSAMVVIVIKSEDQMIAHLRVATYLCEDGSCECSYFLASSGVPFQ